ncbi:peroxiredoxin family protein [Oceanibium sediminis]|uniref:peroxiredoxin family protein n=1 Tax=Oceanibium sediminis TaxID=2026339 RepID=UPI000DD46D13|nr:peroxiredoxin [Oceanibium sediminis]
MPLSPGDTLPDVNFVTKTGADPDVLNSIELLGKGRAVLFGMPGAFTSTCSSVHVPSILPAMDAIRAKGVDTVAIVSVNDPFTMEAWGRQNGALDAGILLLADPEAKFSEAMGTFTVPERGLINRSIRYVMTTKDGEVDAVQIETGRGTCELTGGAAALDLLG